MPLAPQAREFLAALAAQNPPGWNEMPPEEGRRMFAGLTDLFGVGPEVHSVENRTVAESVPVRVYRPDGSEPRPVVMFFHGGGWVLGDLETHDPLCRRLCRASECVVVSVDYRRSPEHRYPAALEDCLAATRWVAGHPGEFAADAGRIVVAGDSAGGNLAAAVGLKARDDGGPAIAGQVLIYPTVEPGFQSPSYMELGDEYGLTRTAMIWFWEQYLGDLSAADGCAAPLRAESLEGLPPAHVLTAEFDVLRDEGERYAGRLREAGVPVTLRRYEGMLHGFLHFAEAFDMGKEAIDDVGAVIRQMVGG